MGLALMEFKMVFGLGILCLSLMYEAIAGSSASDGKSGNALTILIYLSARSDEDDCLWAQAVQQWVKSGQAQTPCTSREIILPEAPRLQDWKEGGVWETAVSQGVQQVPTVVFLDHHGRTFSLLPGKVCQDKIVSGLELLQQKAAQPRPMSIVNDIPRGGQAEEEAKAVCRGMAQVPPEAWMKDYPGTMRRLRRLGCHEEAYIRALEAAERLERNRETVELLEKSQQAKNESDLRASLAAWLKKSEDTSLKTDEQQFFLLTQVYPLWVRLSGELYEQRGGHSGKSEEAFFQSIAVLEKVRDLDRNSVWGKKAHELREELRKARLSAAKYD